MGKGLGLRGSRQEEGTSGGGEANDREGESGDRQKGRTPARWMREPSQFLLEGESARRTWGAGNAHRMICDFSP